MRDIKTLHDRQAEQLRAKERLAQKMRERAVKPKAASVDVPVSAATPPKPARPWLQTRIGQHDCPLYKSGDTPERLFLQPWARSLIDIGLAAAETGSIHLCLLWPVEMAQLAIAHGIANLQRNLAGDFQGLRAVFFPGNHSTRLAMQSVGVDRSPLVQVYRSSWSTGPDGTSFMSATRSRAFETVLKALNEIELWNGAVSNPPMAALVPSFVFERDSDAWSSSSRNQLDAALTKIRKRSNRKEARESIGPDWEAPASAPGALMVLHNNVTKSGWKRAFSAEALRGTGKPELLWLDATALASRANTQAVRRIPDLLKAYLEAASTPAAGAVIVTDDPRTYFAMRNRLGDLRIRFEDHIWAGESEDPLLSNDPMADDWVPETRDNARCRVSIVDKEAGEVAAKFHQIADDVGGDEHPGHKPLMDAFMFLLRLSNLPAGIRDLAEELHNLSDNDYSQGKFSWSCVVVGLQSAMESGVLSGKRLAIERVVDRADQLVSAWVESTPMAERMLASVLDAWKVDRKTLVLVMPNRTYVSLAKRFLQRRTGSDWSDIESRIEWHTLSSFAYMLQDESRNRHYMIVGLTPRVLRLLLTHPDLPHGTNVLLSHKQADSALKTVRSMKSIGAFKPYRGRLGVLEEELSRRLQELPPRPFFDRVGDFALTFDLSESLSGSSADQSCYRFELDGARPMYVSGWVYRYDPEDGFRRTAAKEITVGQLVFSMTEVLRARFEEALELSKHGSGVSHNSARALLKLYHNDVQARCAIFFPGATNRAALARVIWEKMVALDDSAKEFGPERIQYWLDLGNHDDQRPHAAKDAKFFKLFCAALEISGDKADEHLMYVRNARRANQDIGRELSARYSEILFTPESAIAYREVPPALIAELQREAVSSVYQVIKITPPAKFGR